MQCSHYPKLIPQRFLFSYAEGCPSYLPWWLQGLETQVISPIGRQLWSILTNQRSEELRTWELESSYKKSAAKYFKRVAKELCISGSIEVFILSQFSAWASLKKCNASKLFVHGGVGANCIWQDTRCDVWCGCCAPLLPPSASVSCSEYRTRFSYTHQISENRYIQSHTASVNETEL